MLNVEQIKCLDELAGAVVARAVRDYEAAYKLYHKCGENAGKVKELRKFFCSEWFSVLSDTDGKYLMRMIENAVEARAKQRGKKKCLHTH